MADVFPADVNDGLDDEDVVCDEEFGGVSWTVRESSEWLYVWIAYKSISILPVFLNFLYKIHKFRYNDLHR